MRGTATGRAAASRGARPGRSCPPGRGRKPRSYEEWSALRRWGKLPPWEPLRPGFELRAARDAAGLSQAELARRLGVSQQAVAQAERATANPTVARLAAWARALGLTLELELRPGMR
jgi:DNA-binding XRE family transcriptional regulator